jgi:hypothetical protein
MTTFAPESSLLAPLQPDQAPAVFVEEGPSFEAPDKIEIAPEAAPVEQVTAPRSEILFPPLPLETDPYKLEARRLNGNPDQRMVAITERLARVPEENQTLASILGDLATDMVGKPMGFKNAPQILRALDILGGVDLLAEAGQPAAETA